MEKWHEYGYRHTCCVLHVHIYLFVCKVIYIELTHCSKIKVLLLHSAAFGFTNSAFEDTTTAVEVVFWIDMVLCKFLNYEN